MGEYYIDLVFYNYILKCLLLIDLKGSQISYEDVGQMDMYIRMYDDLKCTEGYNPTIGLLLCSETSKDLARYSILKDSKQLYAAKYLTYLPSKEELTAEIERQKRYLPFKPAKIKISPAFLHYPHFYGGNRGDADFSCQIITGLQNFVVPLYMATLYKILILCVGIALSCKLWAQSYRNPMQTDTSPLKIERDALGAVYYWIDNNAFDLGLIDYSDLYETYMTPIEEQLFEDCTQLFIKGKLRLEPAFLKTWWAHL